MFKYLCTFYFLVQSNSFHRLSFVTQHCIPRDINFLKKKIYSKFLNGGKCFLKYGINYLFAKKKKKNSDRKVIYLFIFYCYFGVKDPNVFHVYCFLSPESFI